MIFPVSSFLVCGLAGIVSAGPTQASSTPYNLKPFTIDLAGNLDHMRNLINNSQLPSKEVFPQVSSDFGIPLGTLKKLKDEWTSQFNWKAEQKEMNR